MYMVQATTLRELGCDTLTLPLHEMFTSIEGEGPEVGTPTIFVRTAGCDFKCSFCDTRKSWDPECADVLTVSKLVRLVERRLCSCVRRVSITGGNPAMHKESVLALVSALQYPGRVFNIEHPGILDQNFQREYDFLHDLAFSISDFVKFHVSMDVKIPLWETTAEVKKRIIDHRELLKAIPEGSSKHSASVKVLIQTKRDFELLMEEAENLTAGLDGRNISYWVAPVRSPSNEVDKILLGHIADGLAYHPALNRPGTKHITWRINPNLHVQLGLR